MSIRFERRGLLAALVAAGAAVMTAGLQPVVKGAADDVRTDLMRVSSRHDDLLAQVESRLPGFGGMYVDEATNTVYVHSVQGGAESTAREALRAVLGLDLSQRRVEVIPARYGFAELNAWHDRALDVLGLPGVVSTDVDDRRNRLTIGVESEALKQAVADRLNEQLVPLDGVDIVVTPAVELENLNAFHRPLVGGLQISFRRGTSTFFCTEGFNAVRAGVAGFVTNSHCTAAQGGVQGTVQHQATIVGNVNRVGVETVDPVYLPGLPGCPAGRVCRRSDTAFIRRDAGVTASQGRVARPLALNSLVWNPANTFRIVREANPVVGQLLTKVGRTTGRTQGVVTATCANINVAGTNITQLCQGQASYASAGGDSGSPVVRIVNSPAANDVALTGIHWGSGGVFSPIGNIQLASEMGAITTCAAGFPC